MRNITGSGPARLQALGQAVELLETARVDYDDQDQEDAYYLVAEKVVAAIVAAPATSMADLRVKAEAIAWCCASRTYFGLGDTSAERILVSMLLDLLTRVEARLEG